MKHILCASALTFALTAIGTAAPASAAVARNYDCAKAGNADKSICKSAAAKAAKVAAKAARDSKKAADKVAKDNARTAQKVARATAKTAKQSTKATTMAAAAAKSPRTYDCAKAGNANKAQCRTAVAQAKPPVASASPSQKSAKGGLMSWLHRTPAAKAGSQTAENSNASGAIAECKDGLFSHAARRDGACSRHGGVMKWL